LFAAGLDLAYEALAAERNAVGHHLTLGDGGAEPPGGAEQHLVLAGAAQAAARRARLDQRLNQHRHRGLARVDVVRLHVAARVGGPQRRPASAHGGEEISFAREPEETFELPGERCARTVLDESR